MPSPGVSEGGDQLVGRVLEQVRTPMSTSSKFVQRTMAGWLA
jgi:hypothetical protein